MRCESLSTRKAVQHRPRARRNCAVRAASSAATNGTHVRAAPHWQHLNDPAHIYAVGNKSVKVQNHGGEFSLEKYMTLPVQQYYVLDPHLITSLGDDSFEFNVPKLQLFNEWIQPSVVATVKVDPTCVHILTKECSMDVSDMIQSLNLDGQWYMIFESTLTWDNEIGNGSEPLRGFERAGVVAQSNGNSVGKPYGVMHGKSRVDVWCELAPGFTFMPRDVLQNACNLALDTLMQGLLPVFMKQLSDDYQKWATNEDYREERKGWNLTRFKQKTL